MPTLEYLKHPHIVNLNEFHSEFCSSIDLLEHVYDSLEGPSWMLVIMSKTIEDMKKLRDEFPFPEDAELVFSGS